MQKDCLEQSLPASAALGHLTSRDGGNAERLLGTISAVHVRTIRNTVHSSSPPRTRSSCSLKRGQSLGLEYNGQSLCVRAH